MNNPRIRLEEIIWETTGACHNNCSFCGSKQVWNEKVNEYRIIEIVKAISKFPPKSIDMSGGDPLLISRETHEKIISILKSKGVECKIIVNLKSLNRNDLKDKIAILSLYDRIGISINNREDLRLFDQISLVKSLLDKTTIITNFNIHNIFEYDRIEAKVSENDCLWMVQFTMFRDENDAQAIYNSESASEHLKDKIERSIKKNVKIVIADNANDGLCSAGIFSCGILSSGEVVPCLSMRSWMDIVPSEGLILELGLETIWKQGFKTQRFEGFKCCKDMCKNMTLCKNCKENNKKKNIDDLLKDFDPGREVSNPTRGRLMLYGVPPKKWKKMPSPEPIEPSYPNPFPDPGVYVYAVPTEEKMKPYIIKSIYSVAMPGDGIITE